MQDEEWAQELLALIKPIAEAVGGSGGGRPSAVSYHSHIWPDMFHRHSLHPSSRRSARLGREAVVLVAHVMVYRHVPLDEEELVEVQKRIGQQQ